MWAWAGQSLPVWRVVGGAHWCGVGPRKDLSNADVASAEIVGTAEPKLIVAGVGTARLEHAIVGACVARLELASCMWAHPG